MAGKREAVIDFIVSKLDSIVPGDKTNGELVRKRLEALTEKEFSLFMEGLKPKDQLSEEEARSVIPFYLPNLSKNRIDLKRMFKLVEDLNRSFKHRLWMTDPKTGVKYLTPHEYICMDIPVRRQAQTGFKKRSIPDSKQQIDDLTGQSTAMSKGSRISSPELKFLDSRNLQAVQTEFVHVRGGNVNAYREFKRRLMQDGQVTLEELQGFGPVKSAETLSAFLNAQHLGNNILPETKVPDDAR